MPLNKDELTGLTTSLQKLRTSLPTTGSFDYTTPAGREVALKSATQISVVATYFSTAARQTGNQSIAPALTRVAASFERMHSGIQTMVKTHNAMNTAGKLTTSGGFATGALSLMAGACSLMGSNGATDYSGPLAEIYTEINSLRQELRAEFLMVAQVLQQEIRVVGQMIGQVMLNQQVILNAVHKALDGIDEVKQLLTEHSQITEAMLKSITTKDLRNATSTVERYRAGTGISSDPKVIEAALDELQDWLKVKLKNPIINEAQLANVSSERMVNILSKQSPLNNLGLVVARLRLLFGNDILDEKYTRLPPLGVYQDTVLTFLLGVEKSQLFSDDACQKMCADIQNTLQLYLDLMKDLQGNTRLWQALFDLYDTHRDKVGRIVEVISHQYGDLAKNMANSGRQQEFDATLHAMEEARLLLSFMTTWMDTSTSTVLNDRISSLDDSVNIYQIIEQKKLESTKKEQVYGEYRSRMQNGLSHLANTNWVTSPAPFDSNFMNSIFPHQWFQEAINRLYLVTIQDDFDKGWSFKSIASSDGGCLSDGYVWIPYGPNPELLSCLSNNPNLPKLLQTQAFSPSPHALQQKNQFPVVSAQFYTYSVFVMYLILNCLDRVNFSIKYPIPREEMAFLKSAQKSDGLLSINNLRETFNYYKLITKGRLRAAKLALEKSRVVTPGVTAGMVDHSCLLFLVAMLGRWDIFDNFANHFPPISLNYAFTIEGGSLTPLMIAAQHGREDVVNGLIPKMTAADILKRSFDNKTAAQMALDQGFYKIAMLLKAGLSATEIQQVQSNLPPALPVAIPTTPNPLAIGLEEMIDRVKEYATKFEKLAEAKRSQAKAKLKAEAEQQNSQQPVAAVAPTSADYTLAEETEDELVDLLETTTDKICASRGIAKKRPSFWNKPTELQRQEIGLRMMPTSLFQDIKQRQDFLRDLYAEATINPSNDVIDDEKCLAVVIKHKVKRHQPNQ